MSIGPLLATEVARCHGTIAAPLEVVWGLVSDFGGVHRWSTGAVTCTVEGEGIGAVRTVERDGRRVRERLERWDADDHSLSYGFVDAVPLPVEHLVATIALRGGHETDITWSARGEVAEPDRGTVTRTLERFFAGRMAELQAVAAQPVERRG